jgi:UDP-arabinose 4-epimerase
MSAKVLLVGGAGYIGSHTAKRMARAGWDPVVYDDLSTGRAEFVKWGAFEQGSLSDSRRLQEVMRRHAPRAVIHFAAHASVEESVREPALYYRDNVGGTLTLLEAMRNTGVPCLVFSSTCAVYGTPDLPAIPESAPVRPVNPYGRGKAMVEQILRDYERAYGIRAMSLRYFNAAGADPEGELGEMRRAESHLIPLALEVAAGRRASITVFGNDYPTADGTCVRDYIHVQDLAEAHLQALWHLERGGEGMSLNLGTSVGYSVLEVLAATELITGRPIARSHAARRPGDPGILVADATQAREVLGWEPRCSSLWEILGTAWSWRRRHRRDIQ